MTPDAIVKKQRVSKLIEAKNKINNILKTYNSELKQIKESKSIKIDWILNLADNITLTDTALPSWIEGMPLIKSHPPAPQPEEMRDSLLQSYHFDLFSNPISESFLNNEPLHPSTLSTIEKLKTNITREVLNSNNNDNYNNNNKRIYSETMLSESNKLLSNDLVVDNPSTLVETKVRKVAITFEADDSDEEDD